MPSLGLAGVPSTSWPPPPPGSQPPWLLGKDHEAQRAGLPPLFRAWLTHAVRQEQVTSTAGSVDAQCEGWGHVGELGQAWAHQRPPGPRGVGLEWLSSPSSLAVPALLVSIVVCPSSLSLRSAVETNTKVVQSLCRQQSAPASARASHPAGMKWGEEGRRLSPLIWPDERFPSTHRHRERGLII